MQSEIRISRRNLEKAKRRPAFLNWIVSLLVAGGLALLCIQATDAHYLPVYQAFADAKISASVTEELNKTIAGKLTDEVTYGDLITLERDVNGKVTSMTTNISAVNKLKSEIVAMTADYVASLNPDSFSIPVGSLTGVAYFSGRGFQIPVKALTAGTVTAEFKQQFTSAGINQTRHQLLIDVSVPVQVFLSGMIWTDTVHADVLVAETVIVGNVPDTYLQISGKN